MALKHCLNIVPSISYFYSKGATAQTPWTFNNKLWLQYTFNHLLAWQKVSHLLFSFFTRFYFTFFKSICICQVSCSVFMFYSLFSFLYNLLSSIDFQYPYSLLLMLLPPTMNYYFLMSHWSWICTKFFCHLTDTLIMKKDLQHKITLVSYLALNSDYHFNQNLLYKLSIYVYTYMCVLSSSHLVLWFSYCRNYHYFHIPCTFLSSEGHNEAKTILLWGSYFLS